MDFSSQDFQLAIVITTGVVLFAIWNITEIIRKLRGYKDEQ